MKIEIVSDLKPFVGGKAREFGEVVECSDADGAVLVANGFALEIKPAKVTRKKA